MAKEKQFMKFSEHYFDKVNLVTIITKTQSYDIYECECGARGKRINMSPDIITADRFKPPCKEIETYYGKKVKIITCTAVGKQFANLTPNSVHEVIKAPNPYIDNNDGVWVMGVNEPVKILNREFHFILE